jgi:cytochrome c oxidase subunit I+III
MPPIEATSSSVDVDKLEAAWRVPTGLAALKAVNHRTVGKRYLVTGFIFFLLAGLLALNMLIQLSRPDMNFLSAELYNQFFTMHGTTMMFLFAVPIVEAFGIYLVPLMIGTRDMAFPRLSAFGYYVYLIGGVTLYLALLTGRAPDAGWFNYVPLAGPQYSPAVNVDFYAEGITFLEVAALAAAIETIVTILRMRAPGMAVNRMPLFVWAILIMSFMTVFAMPPLVLASFFLALDRVVGTQFFNVVQGGNSLLWQHLFWWFGHPEVYIIAIPAFGIISTVIPTFSRRRIAVYLPMTLALITIGIVSFGLWVHHMFASGISVLGMSFFAAASMAIAIPSGVQVFAWLGTMWESKGLVWRAPMIWAVGGIVTFVAGGITGIMVAAVPFDWQVHDSHFVTAHFHYVLLGGSVLPFIAAVYYWFPKITGRMLDERLGRWSFWLTFLGFNVAFFTMHYTGFLGMPRRVYTYMDTNGWSTPMTITAAGAFVLATGIGISVVNVVTSLRRGAAAEGNPWQAATLEWATSSPPPGYNFAEIPEVSSHSPLWDVDGPLTPAEQQPGTAVREVLGTSMLDARPEHRIALPYPSLWPLVLAVSAATIFIGAIVSLSLVPVGLVLTTVAIVGWNWPRGKRDQKAVPGTRGGELPVDVDDRRSIRWWGMLGLVVIEFMAVVALIFTYFYLRFYAPQWPLGSIQQPALLLPGIGAALLLASVLPILWGYYGIRHGNRARLLTGLAAGGSLALAVLVLTYYELLGLGFTWQINAYGSIVWVILGYVALQSAILLLWSLIAAVAATAGHFGEEKTLGVRLLAFYWTFVALSWIPLFATVYVIPWVL